MIYRKHYIIALLVMMILLSSCSFQLNDTKDIENQYDKFLINGLTEQEYITEIETLLEVVYAPKNKISRDIVKELCLKYMTPECADDFIGIDKEYTAKDIEITINEIDYVYGIHQTDGIDRLLASITIKKGYGTNNFSLEMRLNDAKKIYEIMVY